MLSQRIDKLLKSDEADWLSRILNSALAVLVLASVALVIENPRKVGLEPARTSAQDRGSFRSVSQIIEEGRICFAVFERYAFYRECELTDDGVPGETLTCPEDVPASLELIPSNVMNASVLADREDALLQSGNCGTVEEMTARRASTLQAFERANANRARQQNGDDDSGLPFVGYRDLVPTEEAEATSDDHD